MHAVAIEKLLSIWTMEGPWRVFYRQGSPKISLAGLTAHKPIKGVGAFPWSLPWGDQTILR